MAKTRFSPGKKPEDNERVGIVSYDKDHLCYMGSNGYYWHGKKGGGWKTYPPGVEPTAEQKLEEELEEQLAAEIKKNNWLVAQKRKRKPNGNEKVGSVVSYDTDHSCYKSSNGYYWHGSRGGKWKNYPPEAVTLNKLHKPHGDERVGSVVSWAIDYLCYKSSNGYYWHGKNGGRWKLYPPGVEPTPEQLEEQQLEEQRLEKEKIRRIAMAQRHKRQPKGNARVGLKVKFNAKHNCYQTDKKYFWHGRRQGGWKTQLPYFDEDKSETVSISEINHEHQDVEFTSSCDDDEMEDEMEDEMMDIASSADEKETSSEEDSDLDLNDVDEHDNTGLSLVNVDNDIDDNNNNDDLEDILIEESDNPWRHRHVPKLFALPDSTPARTVSPEELPKEKEEEQRISDCQGPSSWYWNLESKTEVRCPNNRSIDPFEETKTKQGEEDSPQHAVTDTTVVQESNGNDPTMGATAVPSPGHAKLSSSESLLGKVVTATISMDRIEDSKPPATDAAAATAVSQESKNDDDNDQVMEDTPDATDVEELIQLVRPGEGRERMRLQNFITKSQSDTSSSSKSLSFHHPIIVRDTPESIGMKIPKPRGRKKGVPLSVRDVANIVGHSQPVQVINVLNQTIEDDLRDWSFYDLVEYFEDEQRLARNEIHQPQPNSREPTATASTVAQETVTPEEEEKKEDEASLPSAANDDPPRRRRRKAAIQSEKSFGRQLMDNDNSALYSSGLVDSSRILNQISYEFSKTPLHTMVRSPQLVRDIDWIDHAWPNEKKSAFSIKKESATSKRAHKGSQSVDYPVVQYYCLTSAAGAYTDFHIDFGGSSVWYHVVRGQKIFLASPPTEENLTVYEEWLCHTQQAKLFLPDLMKKRCGAASQEDTSESASRLLSANHTLRFTLDEGETLILPAGWIHAVYTPVDSLVFGGNFLHGFDMKMQLRINALEARRGVLTKYRFPHFGALQMYAGGMYLQRLKRQRRGRSGKQIKSENNAAAESPADHAKPPTPGPMRSSCSDTNIEDPLKGLSDMAQEYLASIQITTAEQLLSARTKDIAEPYPAWRKKKGKPPVNNPSPVISSWKTRVRQLAAQAGATDLVQLNLANQAVIPGSEEAQRHRKQQKQNYETLSPRELEELPMLINDLEQWYNIANETKRKAKSKMRIPMTQDLMMSSDSTTFRDAASYVTDKAGCESVEDFIAALRKEHAIATGEDIDESIISPNISESTGTPRKKRRKKQHRSATKTTAAHATSIRTRADKIVEEDPSGVLARLVAYEIAQDFYKNDIDLNFICIDSIRDCLQGKFENNRGIGTLESIAQELKDLIEVNSGGHSISQEMHEVLRVTIKSRFEANDFAPGN